MENTIQFELVSPEERLVSEPVRTAVLPSLDGEMGVGAKHSALLAQLGRGVVSLYNEGGEVTGQYYIADGFVDITNESCTVLAESATALENLDKAALEAELAELKKQIDEADHENYPALFDRYQLVSGKLYALESKKAA